MPDGRDLGNLFLTERLVVHFFKFESIHLVVEQFFLLLQYVVFVKEVTKGPGAVINWGLHWARWPTIGVFGPCFGGNERVAAVLLLHVNHHVASFAVDNPRLTCGTRGAKGNEEGSSVSVNPLCHPGKFLWLFPAL